MQKLKHWLWWFNKTLFGPEQIVNGDFSDGTNNWSPNGATLSIDAGRLKAVTTAVGDKGAIQDISLTSGLYKVTVGIVLNDSTAADAGFRVTDAGFGVLGLSDGVAAGDSGSLTINVNILSDASYKVVLDRRSANSIIGDVVYFDNVSMKKIL